MLNKYLNGISIIQRVIFIIVLAYMAIWMGTLRCDGSFAGGKNVINFFLIYTLGNTLRIYQDKWKRISATKLLLIYVLLNVIMVTLWMYFRNNILGEIIMRISFWYCSPFLYINAVLLFMIFGKMKFQSRWINYCASSVFAIYLLHCQPFMLNNVIAEGATAILNITHAEELQTLLLFGVYALVIVAVCILVDKLFTPLWRITTTLSRGLENRIRNLMIR